MMKNPLTLLCAAAAFLAASGTAKAATISLAVSSTTATAGGSGQLVVSLANGGSDTAYISAFSVGLLSDSASVVLTSTDIGATGYIFEGDSFSYIEFAATDISTTSGGQTLIAADSTDSGGGVTIVPGQTVVLAVAYLAIASSASPSVVTVSFLPYSYTSLADADGNNVAVSSTTSGTVTIAGTSAVPEPSTLSMALLAGGAFCCRRLRRAS